MVRLTMGESDEFDTLAFEKRLTQLKDTQESIQALSAWCLKQREHHKKIVQSWLNVLKIAKIDQRLVLFYLANDVIQYSKRKGYKFVESWGLNLQKATPLVRDEKVRHKILRIFKIWEQRSVYDDEFLSDLTGLLSVGATKKTDDDNLDFQPQQLVNKIKQCTVLESDTDIRLKNIHDCPLQLHDPDELSANLKDRSNKDDVEKELSEGIGCMERYTEALQREIVAREALLALLASADQYYSTQRGEVKVVAYAYKNFGARVRALKRKLDELVPTLPRAPSPPRDQDVPSPAPDEDIDLPNDQDAYNIDKTFNTSLSADGALYNMGLSSFLNTSDAMAIFNNTQTSENAGTVSLSSKPQETLPGLDLLSEPPPLQSFYGSTIDLSDDPEPYSVTNSPWNTTNNNASWNVSIPPPAPVPPPTLLHADPPASPPPAAVAPLTTYTTIPTVKEIKAADVDHRGLHSLPPPPPPPILPILGQLEDVDHRLLPSLPPPPPSTRHVNTGKVSDVDHRNLISLTQQPPPSMPQRSSMENIDQDYRAPPPDIVESVDMDLSEDEEGHSSQPMYEHEDPRRNSNNKVLVGGHNGQTDRQIRRTNSYHSDSYREQEAPLSAPPRLSGTPNMSVMPNMSGMPDMSGTPNMSGMPNMTGMPDMSGTPNMSGSMPQSRLPVPPPHSAPPLSNPFDKMPDFSVEFNKNYPDYQEEVEDSRHSNDSAYEEDLRNRGIDPRRTPSPQYDEEYRPQNASFQPTNRFPRNWTPRNNFRPQFNQQFYPRNQRPNRPWRPQQRFW